eukprot:m.272339 g.272339  ORF g.272339 m.272339 type:complete len:75 (+) comp40561_c0_seq6:613-837(+)
MCHRSFSAFSSPLTLIVYALVSWVSSGSSRAKPAISLAAEDVEPNCSMPQIAQCRNADRSALQCRQLCKGGPSW